MRRLGRPRDSKVNKRPRKSQNTNEKTIRSAGSDVASRTNGDITDGTYVEQFDAAQGVSKGMGIGQQKFSSKVTLLFKGELNPKIKFVLF